MLSLFYSAELFSNIMVWPLSLFRSPPIPPNVITLDDHVSPSVSGTPPGLLSVAPASSSRHANKKKKTTAQPEKKKMTAKPENIGRSNGDLTKNIPKKKTSRRWLETESKSSNSTENLIRLHQFFVEKEKKQEGSSAAGGAKIPLWVEVPEQDGSSTSSN